MYHGLAEHGIAGEVVFGGSGFAHFLEYHEGLSPHLLAALADYLHDLAERLEEIEQSVLDVCVRDACTFGSDLLVDVADV